MHTDNFSRDYEYCFGACGRSALPLNRFINPLHAGSPGDQMNLTWPIFL